MKNIFDAIPDSFEDEIFEKIVDTNVVKIERIISRGHTTPENDWYDQEMNEWVTVLRGGARLEFDDGSTVDLRPGDHVDIKAHRRHRVAWTDPGTETIWLAVHY